MQPDFQALRSWLARRRDVAGLLNLNVRTVDRIWMNLLFREVPVRNMVREDWDWTLFELCKVTLECGVVGFGETTVYHSWGRMTDAGIRKVTGRHAAEHMWDDSIGAGLQIALFEAVAKANGVPVYRLLGAKRRDRAFLAWWAIDMPRTGSRNAKPRSPRGTPTSRQKPVPGSI